MLNTIKPLISGLIISLISSTAQAAPGYMVQKITADHRDKPLQVRLWYPSAENTPLTVIGKNAVFVGEQVHQNAEPKTENAPLILFSHGSGGNADNMSWLAATLVEQGYVVAAPNHHGTTSGDSTPLNTVKLWERPADLRAVLDHLETTPINGVSLDMNNITAMGFSLGGYTAMALGGARVSKADYISYCDAHVGLWDCAWLADIDLPDMDQTTYEQDNSDPRITSVIAIDPALAQAYQADSLQQMDIPVQLINLGNKGDIAHGVNGESFIEELPNGTLEFIEDTWHFSFLGKCTKGGWVFIKAVGEDPICTDISDRTRDEIHMESSQKITEFLYQINGDKRTQM